jgi:hypothetical protein
MPPVAFPGDENGNKTKQKKAKKKHLIILNLGHPHQQC